MLECSRFCRGIVTHMTQDPSVTVAGDSVRLEVALLTGGGDRPYALGLATSLLAEGVFVDFIGSDNLESPALVRDLRLRFLNLRGDQSPSTPVIRKLLRVFAYDGKLLHYAATAKPRVFHILWNNKFELLNRTLLLLYYRLMSRRIVLTVHNVNVKARDGNDGLLNRLTLRIQYALADHLFVHTPRMQRELETDFQVAPDKITVIPFGINSPVPTTALSRADARRQLGLTPSDNVVLFFGNIAPYKGIEYLVEAMGLIVPNMPQCRLLIAGRLKGDEPYWLSVERRIDELELRQHVFSRIEYHSRRRDRAVFQGGRCPRLALHLRLPERRAVPRVQLWPAGNRVRCRRPQRRNH